MLNINIRSFSYKRGIPNDPSGNGGGFVFDCRGILNPGRLVKYKTLTGKDKEVIEFLENQTRIGEFLNGVFQLVDLTIEDYLNRDFTNLEINFGCTGGQHRSVYSAEQTAKHIQEKFTAIQIHINHIEQDLKSWNNNTV